MEVNDRRCKYTRALSLLLGLRYVEDEEEIPSSCQEKEPFEAKAAKKKGDYEKLMVAYNKKQVCFKVAFLLPGRSME